MVKQSKVLSQKTRLLTLLLYIAGLALASYVAFGTILPPSAEKGLWLYSALAALLLGNLIITPFFTKPSDAIAYAVAALVALLAVNAWQFANTTDFDRFLWTAVLVHVAIALIAGITAIAFKDSTEPWRKRLAETMFVLCDHVGNPRAVFSSVFLFALIAFHRDEPREYIIIGISWALFVGLRPLESLIHLSWRWRRIWKEPDSVDRVGTVVGHEVPGVVLVKQDGDSGILPGELLVARSENGGAGIALVVDHVGFTDGPWLRALQLSGEPPDLAGQRGDIGDEVFRVNAEILGQGWEDPTWAERDRLVGLVAPETTVRLLQIEVTSTVLDLYQGALLEVAVSRQRVLYQIIDGKTREEIIREKNTRGFVRAEAKKIGSWNSEKRKFDLVQWLPQPNSPVFLAKGAAGTINKGAVGHFPATQYSVQVTCGSLVTHNTAILGILGVGKSFLALELVERLIAEDIKVICLDLTDQYATELGLFHDAEGEEAQFDELQQIGEAGKAHVCRNVEEGGSARQFAERVKENLGVFLDPTCEKRLKILNPARFTVWRQDSRPFNNEASMATLTPCEITRIFTEAALEALQEQGMTNHARCCLVYEEAHSLIPEWNAVASDGDKTATNGTAKAILQGRKFGLGCLIVTQRTANVTKSILNQCNTIFALRVFDATGMDFLKNYIGDDYAGVLSALEDRHAVIFGRASSCRDPVVVRLNNRDDFIRIFRDE